MNILRSCFILLGSIMFLTGFSWSLGGDKCNDALELANSIETQHDDPTLRQSEAKVLSLCPDGAAAHYITALQFERIAILGALILISFKNNLANKVNEINISEAKKNELLNNAENLADTQPPKNLTAKQTEEINKLIKASFIRSFNFVVYISVALTWLGSLIAFFTVKKGILSG